MSDKVYLILENGAIFEGKSFGARGDVTGEIVFTTGMTGYLETLTDQTYYGKIILQTFPLIGNYGVIPSDFESSSVKVKGYIVKHPCSTPSNFRSEEALDTFLKEQGVVGLYGIDTRALTKIIRDNGEMNGKITTSPPTEADRKEAKAYKITDAVASVSSRACEKLSEGSLRVALIDFGAKRSIASALASRDCEVWTFPHDASLEDILKIKPHGVMLSNGPGDPAAPENKALVKTIRALFEKGLTIFGISLGHQLLSLAKGYKSKKMKFGHRGSNQPVKDLKTGSVYITNQNHGYEIIADACGAASCADIAYVNVNDGTLEGLDYGNSFSVQFYPSLTTAFVYDRFIERMSESKGGN